MDETKAQEEGRKAHEQLEQTSGEGAPINVPGSVLSNSDKLKAGMNRKQRRILKSLERSTAKAEAFKQRGRP